VLAQRIEAVLPRQRDYLAAPERPVERLEVVQRRGEQLLARHLAAELRAQARRDLADLLMRGDVQVDVDADAQQRNIDAVAGDLRLHQEAADLLVVDDDVHPDEVDADAEDRLLGRRLFGAFLTWLQEKKESVFVAATANDLTATPPELLRKGRFDEIFFVDLPDAAERREIFSIHLKLRKQEPEKFEAAALVEATEGFSGAEIEQVVIAALYGVLSERGKLTTERLLAEAGATVPLSRSRREYVDELRRFARERFVPAR